MLFQQRGTEPQTSNITTVQVGSSSLIHIGSTRVNKFKIITSSTHVHSYLGQNDGGRPCVPSSRSARLFWTWLIAAICNMPFWEARMGAASTLIHETSLPRVGDSIFKYSYQGFQLPWATMMFRSTTSWDEIAADPCVPPSVLAF